LRPTLISDLGEI